MWDMIGNLVSAGANLIQGSSNRESQERMNAQNLAVQQQMARENIALQREFAQSGITWKVNDAVRAGLHPLIGAGAQAQSFSPVSIGGGGEAPKLDFGSMGQDLARAIKAAASANDRATQDEETGRKLALEKAGLENDVLRQELASKQRRSSASNGQLGPPMPGNTSVTLPERVPIPRPGPSRTVSGEAVKDDDIKQKFEDFPQTKYGRPFGYRLEHNPWFGDGQSFEDRYGDSELGSTVKLGANMTADHWYTARRRMDETDRRWVHPRSFIGRTVRRVNRFMDHLNK